MIIKKIILSLLVVIVVSFTLNRGGDAPVFSIAAPKERIPILMYHKVNPYFYRSGLGLRVPPRDFEAQMKYLKEQGYNTISLDQLMDYRTANKPLPARPIIITFDDGYEDNFRFAYPILKKYGYTATIFLVYNQIGGYNAWDAQHSVAHRIKLLSLPQIRVMQKYGISFQSHTLTHRDLTSLNAKDAQSEINISKKTLEKALGMQVNFLAYPYGRRSPITDQMVRKAGYRGSVSTMMGKNSATTDPFILKRLRVTGHMKLDSFAKMIER